MSVVRTTISINSEDKEFTKSNKIDVSQAIRDAIEILRQREAKSLLEVWDRQNKVMEDALSKLTGDQK